MNTDQLRLDLDPEPDPQVRWLSRDCAIRRDDDLVIVFVGDSPLFRFAVGDVLEARLVAALLAEAQAAPIGEIQAAFDVDDSTLWRARQQLTQGGVGEVLKAKRGPKGPTKLQGAVLRRIVTLRRRGHTLGQIGKRLSLSPTSVRRALDAAGEKDEDAPQTLPLDRVTEEVPAAAVAGDPKDAESPTSGEVSPEPQAPGVAGAPEAPVLGVPGGAVPASRASTPEDARLYAMLGMAPDGEAEVVFTAAESVAGLGFLLAIPALTTTGLLEATREVYGRLRKGVYGLRATVLVLAMMTFLRRPRPEHLKGKDPAILGDVMGLQRAPEVKTIRRKLTEIAAIGKAHELARDLASRWLRENEDLLGVLYVDGHVRVYHGQEKLPKAHVTQRNMCAPATTDYWVNDVTGDPVFVVTAPANAHLTEVIPGLLDELESLGGDRKGTLVFDRGGWSPELFRQILERPRGWHILTYRKGKIRKHPRKGFTQQSMVIDGKKVTYRLSERTVRLKVGKKKTEKSRLELREIAVLRDDGGQTIIVTSHFDQPAVLLAYRMFERWRQENYFRYMKENFGLDALVDYEVEPDDPMRDVPNPKRKKLDQSLAKARAELADIEREYGAAAVDNPESERPSIRGFKIANGKLGQALRAARGKVAALERRRSRLPKRVAIGEVLGDEKVVKLSPERKLFTDMVKASVYRAESRLLGLLRPHFKRTEDEGRAFLQTAIQQPGSLAVQGDLVTVRLAPMSAPRFTAALQALCDELNALAPRFPETSYRLRYEVAAKP